VHDVAIAGAGPVGATLALALADAAGTEAESEPGRAILKPIVEPATTASRSQQMVRRGTF